MLADFTLLQWLLAVVAGFCIGLSKSGFSGVGLVTVLLMASLFPDRQSTGVLLPLLICGDVLSVLVFHQHAKWQLIWKMLPPTLLGVVGGYLLMGRIADEAFGPVIGAIVLLMVILQLLRQVIAAHHAALPHTRWFAWMMGVWSGLATMLANAAGPVMSLYFLAIGIPKYELLGTSAWFFLIVNLLKVPLSAQLGLISPSSLLFNLCLVPAVVAGTFAGRSLIKHIPQKRFEQLLLCFATLAALRFMRVF